MSQEKSKFQDSRFIDTKENLGAYKSSKKTGSVDTEKLEEVELDKWLNEKPKGSKENQEQP